MDTIRKYADSHQYCIAALYVKGYLYINFVIKDMYLY